MRVGFVDWRPTAGARANSTTPEGRQRHLTESAVRTSLSRTFTTLPISANAPVRENDALGRTAKSCTHQATVQNAPGLPATSQGERPSRLDEDY